MPSQVWGRDPQEAFENPYEYKVQEQFVREASSLLSLFYRLMNDDRHKFRRDDRSVEKAIWMLQLDALDSQRDCLKALVPKNHRVAGKLFRDIVETLDLAAYFASRSRESSDYLEKWYSDEIVPHRVYREVVRRTEGNDAFEQKRRVYMGLSKFTHRSYRAICDGYLLGANDQLVHDAVTSAFSDRGEEAEAMLVLPQTIASYFANLAELIQLFSDEIHRRGVLPEEQVCDAVAKSLELESVPRRFLPRRWLADERNSTTSPDEASASS
jgi:hypothetical protein